MSRSADENMLVFRRGIIGAGGGGKGGGGGGIDEDPDSARSRARARGVEIITEGPCGGPVDGLKSFLYDGVPVENEDGSRNFQGHVAWRVGTQSQSALPYQEGVSNIIPVQSDVTYHFPATINITNTLVDAVIITLVWPGGMITTTDEGDISKNGVTVRIERESNNGGFVPVFDGYIREKTQAQYQRDFYIPLEGEFPFRIRVIRVSEDETSSLRTDAFQLKSYSEVIETKLRYPLLSVVGYDILSTQFNRIPKRTYHWRGILCSVPKNYDPETRVYRTTGEGTTNGVWDGTYKRAWTDCPAWLLLELVSNKRWGMGHYVGAEFLHKWTLYKIAQYCDEKVPDGKGGMEPRWTFFAYLSKQQDAWRVFDLICSAFRGFSYWSGGTLRAVADMPAEPAYTYTAANVSNGMFAWQGGSLDTRFTRVICYYNDDEQQGKRMPVVVDDPEGIRKYGIIPKELDGHCRSEGQAARIANSVLITNLEQNNLVTWRVPSSGVYRMPGQVVEVFDPGKSHYRRSGRADRVRENNLWLDREVEIRSGVTYRLILIHQDDRKVRYIENSPGETSLLILDEPLDDVENPRDIVWVLSSDEISPQLIQLKKVEQVESEDDETGREYELTGFPYRADKFTRVDEAAIYAVQGGKQVYDKPETPTNLKALQRLYRAGDGGTKLVAATFSWNDQPKVQKYAVTLTSDRNPSETQYATGPSISLDNVLPGTYVLSVIAIIGDKRSKAATAELILDGANAPEVYFTANKTSTRRGLPIQFNSNTINAPDAWFWDFGDGTTSGQQNPTKIYNEEGSFDVSLTASNRHGENSTTRRDYIRIDDDLPVADFTYQNVDPGYEVDFAAVLPEGAGQVDSYEWAFGDSSATGFGETVSHIYATPGDYLVTLVVSAQAGSDTISKTVTVT